MTRSSAKSASTRVHLRTPLLDATWRWLCRRADGGLLGAMQNSRRRAARKLFQEYAHLIADDRKDAGDKFTPKQ